MTGTGDGSSAEEPIDVPRGERRKFRDKLTRRRWFHWNCKGNVYVRWEEWKWRK